MTIEEAQRVVDYMQCQLDVDATVYEDYSGRGMYGKTCAGIVTSDAIAVGQACGAIGVKAPRRTDSMGLDIIAY